METNSPSFRPENIVIADMIRQTRKLIHFYLGKLEGKDLTIRPELGGMQFNSPLWILCHITWAQNNLILRVLGDTTTGPEWLEKFHLGSVPTQDFPPQQEIMDTMNKVHEKSLEMIQNMELADLDKPLYIAILNWKTDIRHSLMHSVRHEGTHIGHLSWLGKMFGVKTI